MDEIDLFVHVDWKSTFCKKSFLLTSCNMLNVLWCVTHAFMILVVLGCTQQITPCHNSSMWLNVGGLGWHHIAWSGIGNSNIIILFNLLDMGGCFFLSLLRGGRVIFLSCSSSFFLEDQDHAQKDKPICQDPVQRCLFALCT